ncbi:hypothetical protein Tco_1275912 [Tanacetum coccineum]
MDQDSAHMVAASKVPMLKLENGVTLPKTQVVEGVTTVMPITSAEDKAHRRLEVKLKVLKDGSFPIIHQLNFNSIRMLSCCRKAIEKKDWMGMNLLKDSKESL